MYTGNVWYTLLYFGATCCRFVQWGIDWCSLVQLTAHGTVCRLVKFGADRFRLVQFGVDYCRLL